MKHLLITVTLMLSSITSMGHTPMAASHESAKTQAKTTTNVSAKTLTKTQEDMTANNSRSPYLLWFDRPADYWEEALPIGNGRVAAMIFGGTDYRRELDIDRAIATTSYRVGDMEYREEGVAELAKEVFKWG